MPDTVSTIIAALRSGIGENQMMAYLVEMAVRLVELHRVLKPTGSLYLHFDPTASHYLKLILDGVFGPMNFRNEIVWERTISHNMPRAGYPRVNDILLFYSKTDDFTFNTIYTEYGEAQMKRFKADENGRLYKAENLTFSTANPSRQFEWRGTKPPSNRSWGGSLEAFLNSLGLLLADLIVADWDAMLPAQKRIVAKYAARELRSGLANVPVDQLPDDGAADAMRKSVRTSHGWMEAAGEFSRTGPNLRVEQPYQLETAPAAVERFFASYWPDGPKFFDWMGSLGHDRGALWVTLTQLISVRNDIAHGLGQVPAPTYEELRLYLARSAHLVRLAIRFCDAAGADSPPAA